MGGVDVTSPAPIVEMHGISIAFPGVKALDNVDFQLLPGEVHALMGENGAGKSTLIKALTGVYAIDAGEIVIDGEHRRLHGTADAQAAGISVVYQEINLCTNLTIGENVMLGHEVRGRFGINWKATHGEATESLAKLGLEHLDTRLPLSSISLAMQQLVAISRAMVTDSTVLILDEPTSSLDAAEVEQLFVGHPRLRDRGVAILFVSHFLDQVYEISDRITVLRNGQFVGTYPTAEPRPGGAHRQDDRQGARLLRSIDAERRAQAHGSLTSADALGARSRTQGFDRADRLRALPRRGRRHRRPARIRANRARSPPLWRRPRRHRFTRTQWRAGLDLLAGCRTVAPNRLFEREPA